MSFYLNKEGKNKTFLVKTFRIAIPPLLDTTQKCSRVYLYINFIYITTTSPNLRQTVRSEDCLFICLLVISTRNHIAPAISTIRLSQIDPTRTTSPHVRLHRPNIESQIDVGPTTNQSSTDDTKISININRAMNSVLATISLIKNGRSAIHREQIPRDT